MPNWSTLAIALALLLGLLPITRWFGLRVQQLVVTLTGSPDAALYFYHFLLLPGVVVHELAHWLTARLLGVGTGKLSLMPSRQGSEANFGSVQVQRSDPLRASIIGVAPLIVGTLLALGIVRHGLGIQGQIAFSISGLRRLWQALHTAPDALLWLYLLVAISTAMLPSASDRQAWPWVAGAMLLVGVMLHLLNRLSPLVDWLVRPASALAFVAATTLLCDLALGMVALALETTLRLLLKRPT